MAKHTVNFKEDLARIQKYISRQIKKQSNDPAPINAIEVGFKLCQSHVLLFNFDTREKHERDGEWTVKLDDGQILVIAQWSKAYMQARRNGIDFVLLDGKKVWLAPGAGDKAVAGIFGTELLSITQQALNEGAFDRLPLRKDCQLEVLEFDGMWEWPAKERDLGKANLISKLRRKPAGALATPPKPAAPKLRPDQEQIIKLLMKKSGLSAEQTRAFLQAQADVAAKLVVKGYPIPGIGIVERLKHPARKMTMQFGPTKGQSVNIPAKMRIKFKAAPALKDVVFQAGDSMPDVFSLDWYATYPEEPDGR